MILGIISYQPISRNFVRFSVSLIKQRLHGKKFRICIYLKWNVLHLLIMDILNKLLSLEQFYPIPKYTQCQMWPTIYRRRVIFSNRHILFLAVIN